MCSTQYVRLCHLTEVGYCSTCTRTTVRTAVAIILLNGQAPLILDIGSRHQSCKLAASAFIYGGPQNSR